MIKITNNIKKSIGKFIKYSKYFISFFLFQFVPNSQLKATNQCKQVQKYIFLNTTNMHIAKESVTLAFIHFL